MDSLTQIVLGAAVGEAVLGKKVGNKAMLWGAIAGTIPDLDVLSRFFVEDILRQNEVHRGFSHSILFCVLAAPALGWLIHKLYKKVEATWLEWAKMIFWCLFTHPLLDAHTIWGTQLFWPLEYKIAYKNIFVADPLYTLPFLVFLLLALFSKRGSVKRNRLNNLGLLVSSCYMLVTIALKGIGFVKFEEALEKQQILYNEMDTKPTPFNSLLWAANIEADDCFYMGYYSILDEDNNINFMRFEKDHHLLGELAQHQKVKRLIKLCEGWYTVVKKEDKLLFNDLRFGQLGINKAPDSFVFSYELTTNELGELIIHQIPRTNDDFAPVFMDFFERIGGK